MSELYNEKISPLPAPLSLCVCPQCGENASYGKALSTTKPSN